MPADTSSLISAVHCRILPLCHPCRCGRAPRSRGGCGDRSWQRPRQRRAPTAPCKRQAISGRSASGGTSCSMREGDVTAGRNLGAKGATKCRAEKCKDVAFARCRCRLRVALRGPSRRAMIAKPAKLSQCAAMGPAKPDGKDRFDEDCDTGRRRLRGLADLPASFGQGPRNPHHRQSQPALDRHRARGAVADADGLDTGTHAHLAGRDRPAHPFPPDRPGARLRGAEALARRQPPRCHHSFRRAARRALFDEERPAQELHRQQQRQRHPQPFERHGRGRARRASGPSRHNGRLRLFDASARRSPRATCRSAWRRLPETRPARKSSIPPIRAPSTT